MNWQKPWVSNCRRDQRWWSQLIVDFSHSCKINVLNTGYTNRSIISSKYVFMTHMHCDAIMQLNIFQFSIYFTNHTMACKVTLFNLVSVEFHQRKQQNGLLWRLAANATFIYYNAAVQWKILKTYCKISITSSDIIWSKIFEPT
jgi:hypothetical protein